MEPVQNIQCTSHCQTMPELQLQQNTWYTYLYQIMPELLYGNAPVVTSVVIRCQFQLQYIQCIHSCNEAQDLQLKQIIWCNHYYHVVLELKLQQNTYYTHHCHMPEQQLQQSTRCTPSMSYGATYITMTGHLVLPLLSNDALLQSHQKCFCKLCCHSAVKINVV